MRLLSILSIYAQLMILIVIGCKPKLKLEPDDKRAVMCIQVSDADEAGLLEQELGMEIKAVDKGTVYFYDEQRDLQSRLKEIGYEIKEANIMQITYKVVKILNKDGEPMSKDKHMNEISEYGIKVLDREEDHWVVQGSLESLTGLTELGYDLQKLDREVRPKPVKIIVPSINDVQKVNEMNVDIYSTALNANKKSVTVYGGAYAYQVDLLTEAGYTVSYEN